MGDPERSGERLHRLVKRIKKIKHDFEKAGKLPTAKVEALDDILDDIDDDIDDAGFFHRSELRKELLEILEDIYDEAED